MEALTFVKSLRNYEPKQAPYIRQHKQYHVSNFSNRKSSFINLKIDDSNASNGGGLNTIDENNIIDKIILSHRNSNKNQQPATNFNSQISTSMISLNRKLVPTVYGNGNSNDIFTDKISDQRLFDRQYRIENNGQKSLVFSNSSNNISNTTNNNNNNVNSSLNNRLTTSTLVLNKVGSGYQNHQLSKINENDFTQINKNISIYASANNLALSYPVNNTNLTYENSVNSANNNNNNNNNTAQSSKDNSTRLSKSANTNNNSTGNNITNTNSNNNNNITTQFNNTKIININQLKKPKEKINTNYNNSSNKQQVNVGVKTNMKKSLSTYLYSSKPVTNDPTFSIDNINSTLVKYQNTRVNIGGRNSNNNNANANEKRASTAVSRNRFQNSKYLYFSESSSFESQSPEALAYNQNNFLKSQKPSNGELDEKENAPKFIHDFKVYNNFINTKISGDEKKETKYIYSNRELDVKLNNENNEINYYNYYADHNKGNKEKVQVNKEEDQEEEEDELNDLTESQYLSEVNRRCTEWLEKYVIPNFIYRFNDKSLHI